jgi:hypothetical protein
MTKDLLAKLHKTASVTLPGGVVRALDDSELASVVGGQARTIVMEPIIVTVTNSTSGGRMDDCLD